MCTTAKELVELLVEHLSRPFPVFVTQPVPSQRQRHGLFGMLAVGAGKNQGVDVGGTCALNHCLEVATEALMGEVGADVDEPDGGDGSNVIDLMAALKQSVNEDKPKKSARRKKSA